MKTRAWKFVVLLACSILVLASCGGQSAAPKVNSGGNNSGSSSGTAKKSGKSECDLLTKEEVEAVIEAKVTNVQDTDAGCLYQTEDVTNTVQVLVSWEGGKAAMTGARAGAKLVGSNIEQVQGLGDEAFFDIANSLHVLQGDVYFNIRNGLFTDPDSAKLLAAHALARLPGASASIKATAAAPKPKIAQVERALAIPPFRTFQYADLQFSVTQGLITNRNPLDPTKLRKDQATLQLTISANNPTKTFARIVGEWQLKLADGTTIKDKLDKSVQAGQTQEFELSDDVPLNATWQGAQLTLTEPGKEPAVLPLDGNVPAAQYPAKIPAGQETSLTSPQVKFKINEASVDLDGANKRAPVGKRYLVFKIVASCSDKYSCLVSPQSFRVFADGATIQPDTVTPVADAVKEGASEEFQVVFLIPATTNSAELELGEAGKVTAKATLDLKSAKP